MSSSISAPARAEETTSSWSLSSALSSIFPVVYAEEEEEEEADDKEESEQTGEDESEGEEGEAEEEEEEDEPEDEYPAIYEACENSKPCAAAKHHFDECQTRVQEGKGFKDENCVEEFFHLSHCASECAAPRLFSKLR